MCFQGSENREKLLAISFLDCFYFPREQPAMGEFLFPFNLEHSSLVILFSQLLFVIPMYTLTNPGITIFDFFLWFFSGRAFLFLLWGSLHKLYQLVQGKYCTCKVNGQNVYAVPQFHGGNIFLYSIFFYLFNSSLSNYYFVVNMVLLLTGLLKFQNTIIPVNIIIYCYKWDSVWSLYLFLSCCNISHKSGTTKFHMGIERKCN